VYSLGAADIIRYPPQDFRRTLDTDVIEGFSMDFPWIFHGIPSNAPAVSEPYDHPKGAH